ncbi:lipopolysaccharide biosynthesis protein [Kushneria pakistanensis]|uniref:Lipopolysaccharide biosynthesis protein n=1 Tax=Kushneria pakistanensis TaxID=1508770 RepID=A0ABQ3FQ26_9GAMM|nr:lipopolysaccharide biosynthesis protein [Kushneria pakistanensis]GHC33365.1 lipopolysaccharide biosynthesis protein [Kushneria pakistanensis]
MSNTDAMNRDLKSGFVFGFIEKYSNLIVQFAVTMVLARFLTPSEFGVVATVMVIIFFFNLLGEMGLGPAIIYHKELTKEEIRGLFLICIMLGMALYFVFSAGSFVAVDFFGNDIYYGVMPLIGAMILFSVLSIVPETLLRREKRFSAVAIITLISALVSGAIACLMAYQEYGVYALVWKSIIHTGMRFVLVCIYAGWRNLVGRVTFTGFKTVLGFSSYQFMFNFLNYFSRNSDKILISKFIGEAAVGLYDMAYRLMMLPIQNIAGIATAALQPVYSTFGQKEVAASYNGLVNKIFFLGFFVGIYTFLFADKIIYVLYGPGWEQSAVILQCLTPFLIFQIVLATTGGIWQTLGQTKSLFYCGVFSSITSVLAIAVGVYLTNLYLVAFLLSMASILNFAQCFWLLHVKNENFRVGILLKGLPATTVLSLVVLAIMFLGVYLFPSPFGFMTSKTLSSLFDLVVFGMMQLLVALVVGGLLKNESALFFIKILQKPLRKMKLIAG